MKNLLFLLVILSSCFIISCTDKQELTNEPDSNEMYTDVDLRSSYECVLPLGPCSDSGIGFNLSSSGIGYNGGKFDLSSCITPSPSSLCTVDGAMLVYFCENQIMIFEPESLSLPDCAEDADYIDWECIRETIVEQLEVWLWDFGKENFDVEIYPHCIFGEPVNTSTIFRSTCTTSCVTLGPSPSQQLIQCGAGDACCYRINTWCDEGDGLEIQSTEIGQFGDCGLPSLYSKDCLLDIPCKPRNCFE